MLVPTSVEDERMFSAIKFLKNEKRNRLGEAHLAACARLHHSKCDLKADGLMEVISTWNESATIRGRYTGKAQPV